jgi:L-threonylcarbamoyladenylate synthase
VTTEDAAAFERCLRGHGVAVFPTDTVYGLGCEPDASEAVERLYRLKGRPRDTPAAVMFFDLAAALGALTELGPRTRSALERLLPSALTLLVPNPAGHFPLACRADSGTLGVRVPRLTADLAPLAHFPRPALQSSANRTGGRDPRRVADVPAPIRRGADLVLDGGELPGTPSTVVDLRRYEERGAWTVVREGAVPTAELGRLLDWPRPSG